MCSNVSFVFKKNTCLHVSHGRPGYRDFAALIKHDACGNIARAQQVNAGGKAPYVEAQRLARHTGFPDLPGHDAAVGGHEEER